MMMGLSLYGVPSITLDKLKGHEIKRKLQIMFVVYVLVIILSCMLPQRIETVPMGDGTLLYVNGAKY